MEEQPSLEHRLASILAGYLTQVHAEANLPPALTIGIGLEMGQRTRPCIVCHIDTVEFPHPKLAQAEGQIILFTHADETTGLQEALWVAALRTSLSNAGAFFAWLGALPEEQRIGWDIRRLRVTRSETDLNREDRTRTHTTRLAISAQSAELTSAA